jgi:hypothetical protein
MSKYLHPDGLSILDTPYCDKTIDCPVSEVYRFMPVIEQLERDKRKVEAQLAVAVEFIKLARETNDHYVEWASSWAQRKIKEIGDL